MTGSIYFDKLNHLIQGASRKFLSDIEEWRKAHFAGLRKLVDDVDKIDAATWKLELHEWLETAQLLDENGNIPLDLPMTPHNWNSRCYLWLTKLKGEFVGLTHQRHAHTSEKIGIYQKLGLGMMLTETTEILQTVEDYAGQLHSVTVNSRSAHDQAVGFKTRIADCYEKLEEEIGRAEKSVDLTTTDPEQQLMIDRLDELRLIIDDIIAAMNLVQNYFDWAANDVYIKEVIMYLDRLEQLMKESLSPYPTQA